MNRKNALYLWLLFLLLSLPSEPLFSQDKKTATPDNSIKGYGILLFDQNVETNRLVSFQMPSVSGFETIYDFGYTYYSAGTCVDDIYYLTSVNYSSNAAERLVSVDMKTREMNIIGTFSGVPYKFADITYDYSTNTLYGIAGSLTNGSSSLYTIDIETATANKIADMADFFFTLASSYDGQLYGISKYGNFCKINKGNGSFEVIGQTGFGPSGNISMEFDHTDKTLYWTVNTTMDESLLCTINTETGTATQIGTLGSAQDAQIAGLYIPFSASIDGTPSAVTDLSIVPDENGACNATLTWVNPTTLFGGGDLNDLTSVDIYRNDQKILSVSPAIPGETSSATDVIEGETGILAEYKVVPVNSKGDGVETKMQVFVGEDLPAAPEDVTIQKTKYDEVRISWTAPTTGINNGWIDLATLKYKVTRQPDNKVLAESLESTDYTDKVEQTGNYTYEITSHTKAGEGQTATSKEVVLGPVNQLPYYCGFENSESLESWTIVDANQNSRTWAIAYYGGSMQYNGGVIDNPPVPADDWLISHDFQLEAGKEYKGTFKVKGMKENKFQVCIGQGNNVENMDMEVFNENLPVSESFTEYSYQFSVNESGLYNIGFHIYSDGNSSFFYLTDVTLEQMANVNLGMLSFSGSRKPVAGKEYAYQTVILNKGKNAISEFTVNIRNAADNSLLSGKNIKETMESGAEKEIEILWTPSDLSVNSIFAEVVCNGDEISADNVSETMDIKILPEGSADIIEIGAITDENFDQNYLFNFYKKNSAALNIYSPEDIGYKSGLIEAFTFRSRNLNDYDIVDIPVKIYMANTDLTSADSQTGWIPESEMTLVYDGTVILPQGENDVTIDNMKKFLFEEGKNLAVLTTHQMSQGYYNQVTFPYFGTTDNSATYYYNSDYTPFNFTNYGNSAWQEKAAVTLTIRTSGAEISGKVTNMQGMPVENAILSFEEHNISVRSNNDGTYIFRYIPDGEYTLKVRKEGYYEKSIPVKVENGQSLKQDISIEILDAYNISGSAVTPDGEALADASVTLAGGITELTVQTAADGSFIFENVDVSDEAYTLTIEKEWYKPLSKEITVIDKNIELGNIAVEFLIYAPSSVNTAVHENNSLQINWITAENKTEFRKDNGILASNLGIDNAIPKTVIGSIYREPLYISSVKWFLTPIGGPHYSVNILIFNLDENGEPTNEILLYKESVQNTDGQWMTYEFEEPVNAPDGCLIALSYYGYLGVGTDSGKDFAYPFSEHTYVFSGNYESGDFDYIEERGFRQNLMIRAEGYRLADNDSDYYEHNTGTSPEFCKYNIWRFSPDQKDDKDSWTKVNSEPISGTSFTDDLSNVQAGIYSYAVNAEYPDGSTSEATCSPYIMHDMLTKITVNVSTNSEGGSAEGATVSMSGSTFGQTATAVVSSEGKATFENMLKDSYNGSIFLAGYSNLDFSGEFTADNEYITDNYQLEEIIVEPFNLTIEKPEDYPSSALFTWNTSGTITDDFEAYNDFENAPSTDAGWIFWDLDQERTYGFDGAEFTGMTEAMSFIIFNPENTTPSIGNVELLQAHSGSKYLASFASLGQNDDWVISPELNYAHEFSFSFFISSYGQVGGYPDYFSVGYTETANPEPTDFIWLAENVAPVSGWTEYSFNIPATAKHVAIRNVSTKDGFILMIDDIYIGSLPRVLESGSLNSMGIVASPKVVYEVYLDGKLVTSTEGYSYMFEELTEGKHTAGVKAVYHSGESGIVTLEFGDTSGITNTHNGNGISIYPNPANNKINVDGEYHRFTITSIDGIHMTASDRCLSSIDVSGLAPGIYIVTFYDAGNQILKRTKLTIER